MDPDETAGSSEDGAVSSSHGMKETAPAHYTPGSPQPGYVTLTFRCAHEQRGVPTRTPSRRGSRIQKGGGGFVHSEGGFSYRISGADPNGCRALGKSTSKKKLQTAVGWVFDHPPPPKKKKKPVSAPA